MVEEVNTPSSGNIPDSLETYPADGQNVPVPEEVIQFIARSL